MNEKNYKLFLTVVDLPIILQLYIHALKLKPRMVLQVPKPLEQAVDLF